MLIIGKNELKNRFPKIEINFEQEGFNEKSPTFVRLFNRILLLF